MAILTLSEQLAMADQQKLTKTASTEPKRMVRPLQQMNSDQISYSRSRSPVESL